MANYWEKFYKQKKQAITSPTPFAKWISANKDLFGIEGHCLELGAGSGRDANLLRKCCGSYYGMDFANKDEKKNIWQFSLSDLLHFGDIKRAKFDVIYSRFFLHCISNNEIISLIEKSKKYFIAEFRVKGDKPVLYKNHKRNFVDMDWLLTILIKNGFKIKFVQVSRGLAKFKNEDPLVGRVIAYKYAR